MNTPDTAVILAAGEGKRLLPHTLDVPKCLVPVNGVPILVNALRALASAGCARAIVVIGHLGERIEAAISGHYAGLDIEYVINRHYRQTNSMYSLALAIRGCAGATWVLEGDVFFEPGLLQLPASANLTWFVDSSVRHLDGAYVEFDPRGAARQLRIIREISRIGGGMGKSAGILRLTGQGVDLLKRWLEEAVAAGRSNEYYDLVLGDRMPDGNIGITDVAGHKWYEIDTPADLAAASRLFAA